MFRQNVCKSNEMTSSNHWQSNFSLVLKKDPQAPVCVKHHHTKYFYVSSRQILLSKPHGAKYRWTQKKCFKQIVTLYKVSVKMLCSLQPKQIHHWRYEKILSSAHSQAHGTKCVITENYGWKCLKAVLDHWLPLLPWLAEVAQAAEISYFNSFTNSPLLFLASEVITLSETEREN